MPPEGKFSSVNPAAVRRSDDLGGHFPPTTVVSSHLCNPSTQMLFGERATDPNAKKGLKQCGNSQ